MYRSARRLAALLALAIPISFIGRAGATWGAAPGVAAPPRAAHAVELSPLASERTSEERAESAVVLVVLDGVRWQDVFGAPSVMPNLHHFLDTDAVALGAPGHGAEITASGPHFISLPGYFEIFAGHPDPVCASNECARRPSRTVADDVCDASGADDVAVITSWPNIARAAAADPSRFVVSAGRKLVERDEVLRADSTTASLLDAGAHLSAFPGEGDYRPDASTARLALRYLEHARPRFLFVGLGDADEYAHRSQYHRYLDAVRASDAFLGDLAATLGGMGARGRHTTVLVTADHGRASDFKDHGARYPESGRVWLVAEGGDVRGHGMLAAARRHTLSDVAPTVRSLLGIGGGDGEPIEEIVGP